MATKTAERTTEIDFTVKPENAVVVSPPAELPALGGEPTTMLNIIARAASDPNTDVEKLDRLLQMQERVDRRQAQVAFDTAMQSAQSEMKRIEADKPNKQTNSTYASYAALDRAIRPIYSRHGFSVSFNSTEGAADQVRLLCRIAHRDGHREEARLDMPADGKGAKGGDVMTKTHATGAAITYGKRYLLGMIFNLAIGEDDDGNGATADEDVEALAPKNAPRDADGKLLSTFAGNKATQAKKFADDLIQALNHADKDAARKLWTDNWKAPAGKRVSPLAWLELHASEQFERVKQAHENAVS